MMNWTRFCLPTATVSQMKYWISGLKLKCSMVRTKSKQILTDCLNFFKYCQSTFSMILQQMPKVYFKCLQYCLWKGSFARRSTRCLFGESFDVFGSISKITRFFFLSSDSENFAFYRWTVKMCRAYVCSIKIYWFKTPQLIVEIEFEQDLLATESLLQW